MRWLRLISLCLIFLLVGTLAAQEDLSWITTLLPTGDDINIEKQLLQGSIEVSADELALNEGFSAVNAWDTIQDRDGFRRIRDEHYEMLLRTSGVIYTGLSLDEYEDTVLSVDSFHISEELNDGYGLVCRASGEAGAENGYHFYISGDGYYRIAVYENGIVVPGGTEWTASALIRQGLAAENSMVAVCVSDYLALYINGELAAEVRDSTYASGTLGMVVILFTPESEVHIGYDNLRVWEGDTDAPRASSGEPPDAPVEVVENTEDQRAVTVSLIEEGEAEIEMGDLVFADNFENDSQWPAAETDRSILEVRDGFLRAFTEGDGANPAVIFGSTSFTNAVFEVDTDFVEGAEDNAFSLICRGSAADSQRGYYFTISTDGFYRVAVSDGEQFRYIVEWDRSLAINLADENHLTLVCVNDYFAFYVNDTLLTEFYDSLYTEGTVGMMVYSYEDATEIAFDNLLVWSAAVR
jgi:hypothetical protein